MVKKIKNFLIEAKAELMKVNWPSRKQTVNYTLLVIGLSAVVAVFLGGLDYGFSFLMKTYILQ